MIWRDWRDSDLHSLSNGNLTSRSQYPFERYVSRYSFKSFPSLRYSFKRSQSEKLIHLHSNITDLWKVLRKFSYDLVAKNWSFLWDFYAWCKNRCEICRFSWKTFHSTKESRARRTLYYASIDFKLNELKAEAHHNSEQDLKVYLESPILFNYCWLNTFNFQEASQ